MISVIICTRSNDISAGQRKNIETSVGTDVEVVVIDNTEGRESIFSAYNKGLSIAKGDILCFMHDDVMFRTDGWGGIIEKHFLEDEKLGLIGFAGAHFLPSAPMYWDESPFISEYDLTTRNGQTEECFFLEHFGDTHPYPSQEGMSGQEWTPISSSRPPLRGAGGCSRGENLIEVAAVDGLCFFMRKELLNTVRFDEENYRGFHLYDMDICMQVRQASFKVCVCRDVLVEHFYNGSSTKAGYDLLKTNLKIFYNKWANLFPLAVGLNGMTEGMIVQLDRYVKQKMESERAYRGISQSKAYRLGKALLKPLKSHK